MPPKGNKLPTEAQMRSNREIYWQRLAMCANMLIDKGYTTHPTINTSQQSGGSFYGYVVAHVGAIDHRRMTVLLADCEEIGCVINLLDKGDEPTGNIRIWVEGGNA